MAYGVFGLNKSYVLTRSKVFSTDATHGWFGGGSPSPGGGGGLTTVERIDFSNDTQNTSFRGLLTQGREGVSSTGNSNYGWFGGGYVDPVAMSSIVDRIDFSNDSSTASLRGPLTATRQRSGATGNSNYGWFAGGNTVFSGLGVTTVNRIDFSNDSSTASPRGPITNARILLAAVSNSDFGWFCGGTPGGGLPNSSLVNRISFINDSVTASIRAPLTTLTTSLTGTENSNYGWFCNGSTATGGNVTSVERLDFSNDLIATSIRSFISVNSRVRGAATGNSNYGWFAGGFAGTTAMERIDFSNDSTSLRGFLNGARDDFDGTSGQAKSSSIRPIRGGNFGWFASGIITTPAVGAVSIVDRVDFSNDTGRLSLRDGRLRLSSYGLTATSNSNYGWFGGGYSVGPLSSVDRVDFSNDSSTATSRGPLNFARPYHTALSNSNYGWFGGGFIPGPNGISLVDRIDFSNDLSRASNRGPLNSSRFDIFSAGNSNYGWFAGGFTPSPFIGFSTIDRVDFSNDSATSSTRGSLNFAKFGSGGTGNSNYGWFGGGYSTSRVTTVQRIDFSNDLSTTVVRGPLGLARVYLSSSGNSNYGWFGGGQITGSSAVSTVERIDFTNDSSSATNRSQLFLARYYVASTSNTPTG